MGSGKGEPLEPDEEGDGHEPHEGPWGNAMEKRQGEEREDDEGNAGNDDSVGTARFSGLPDYGRVTHFTKDRNKGIRRVGKPNLHGSRRGVQELLIENKLVVG
jgi:hypothetical protein